MSDTVATAQIDSENPAEDRDVLLRRFPKWTLAHWCIVVAAASFLSLAILPEGRLNDFDVPAAGENVRVARSLALHGKFADPFAAMKTGATAHVAPVYPFLYSLVLRVFGTGYAALLILWAANVACFALQMGLLPLLAYRLGLGVVPGIFGAALGTLSLYAPIDTRWESFFAGLLFLIAFLTTERSLHHPNRAALAGAGILWGLLVLTNPVFILLLLASPIWWIFTQPIAQRGKVAQLFAFIIAFALLVVSPWIVRNYARFGTFIFVRDNFGLELYTDNNPCATPSIRENLHSGCHFRTHPNPNPAVAAQLAAVGEVSFNHAKFGEALQWIRNNRRQFLSLTVRRFRLFWFPDLERWWQSALVWAITFLSIIGLWVIARKNPVGAWLIGVTWLLFPVVYYITQFEPRYRYPIFWTSLLLAGCALLEIFRRLSPRRAQ